MYPDEISVISLPASFSSNKESKDNAIKRNNLKQKNVSHIKLLGYLLSILAFCTVCTAPQTLIPRSNSIFYQKNWFEFTIVAGFYLLMDTAIYVLDLVTYFGYKSMSSFKTFLRIYTFLMILWVVPYLIAYFTWCSYLGYNWPIPYLGYNIMIGWIAFPVGLWMIIPCPLRQDKEFRGNMKFYAISLAVIILMVFLREKIAILFQAIPSHFQWVVALIIPILKHLEKWLKSKLYSNMTGGNEEESKVWFEVKVNSIYAYFVAVRISDAQPMTVCLFVLVDFVQQLQMTYKIIQCHKKIGVTKDETVTRNKQSIVIKLVLAEMTEGITPLVFAIGFAMAYYGPNSAIIGNVKNEYWGYKKVDNVEHLFRMMLLLFGVDTFSMIVNYFILQRLAHVNLYREFSLTMKKYWFFMALVFAMSMSGMYAFNDINLGMDSTGKFGWITKEGRFELIINSTDLSEEEKTLLMQK